jgi:hypothetical protein
VDVVFAGTVDEVSQNTPEFIFHAKMDDVDMFWSNCETMTCADKESNQVGAYIQLLRTLRAATITVRGRIATGRNGALCKRLCGIMLLRTLKFGFFLHSPGLFYLAFFSSGYCYYKHPGLQLPKVFYWA